MANREKKSSEVPPGATRKALDRQLDSGGGAPGSAAGPRHASADEGADDESFGRMETMANPARPDLENQFEEAAPSPRKPRTPVQRPEGTVPDEDFDPVTEDQKIPPDRSGALRLKGFEAIEYAEQRGLLLNKHPDSITGPRVDLSVAEATGIAEDDEDLIWLDVDAEEYYSGEASSYEPGR
jgi:hypothetical protein